MFSKRRKSRIDGKFVALLWTPSSCLKVSLMKSQFEGENPEDETLVLFPFKLRSQNLPVILLLPKIKFAPHLLPGAACSRASRPPSLSDAVRSVRQPFSSLPQTLCLPGKHAAAAVARRARGRQQTHFGSVQCCQVIVRQSCLKASRLGWLRVGSPCDRTGGAAGPG